MRSRNLFQLALAGLLLISCQTLTNLFVPSENSAGVSVVETPVLTEATTLPGNETQPPVEAPSTSAPQNTLSQRQQRAIFQDLWETIRDEYLYPDFNGLDWNAIHKEYLTRIDAGMSDDDFYYAMDEMIFRLGDEHSVFLSPAQVAEEEAIYAGNNDYVGIGIYVGAVPDRERAVIFLVFPGSPAESAGLKARDSILRIDGQAVLDEEGYLTDAMLGPEGSQVLVTAQTPGEAPRELTITRGRISGSLPILYNLLPNTGAKRIGYIMIPTFSDGSIAAQVGDALTALSADGPLDGLIVDNRINDGGYDTQLRQTLSYFTEGVVGYFVNRQGKEALSVRPNDIRGSQQVPMVVLIGQDTASYGEVFAGVLQDLWRATLIGETTDGNVETLWGFEFDDGSRAWIAHDVFKPVNNPEIDWETNGVIPEIRVYSSWDEYNQGNDPAILAALDVLLGK